MKVTCASDRYYAGYHQTKKAEEEIIYLSYHDKLTGLNTRRYYEERIKALDTKKNLPISIIIGDVNGLKLINDVFLDMKDEPSKAASRNHSACRKEILYLAGRR